MADVVKKHSISSELAQKMVDEAVAKARQIGVSENIAIFDDGGNLKAFSRMDGAPILSIEIAQNKAYTALFGVPTQDFFNFIQRDPSLLAGIPTLARVAAYGGGFPIKVDGEVVGAIGVSGAPTVQHDVDCAKAALALVPDAMPANNRAQIMVIYTRPEMVRPPRNDSHPPDRADAVRRGQRHPLRLSPLRESGGVPLVFNQHFTGTMDHWDPAVTDGFAATGR